MTKPYTTTPPSKISVYEMVHRAEIGKPFIIIADEETNPSKLMRLVKSAQTRLSCRTECISAKVIGTATDYTAKAVVVTVISRDFVKETRKPGSGRPRKIKQ